MGPPLAPNLLPNISQVNSADTSNAVTQDTTLTNDSGDDGSTNFSDVLNSLVNVAPSLLLLSKTPQSQLPRVTGGTPNAPTLAQPQMSATQNQIFLFFIILIIAVVAILLLKKG